LSSQKPADKGTLLLSNPNFHHNKIKMLTLGVSQVL